MMKETSSYRNQMTVWLILLFDFINFSGAQAQHIDYKIVRSINHIDAGKGFNNSMVFITHSAAPLQVVGVLGMGFAGYLAEDPKLIQTSITTGIALMVNQIFTSGIKEIVKRPRPTIAYNPTDIMNHGVWLENLSFPSLHTSSAFTFATTVTLAYPKWYVAVPLYAWASSVAFSRMYLGVHYPSDVLGGIALGVGSAYLTRAFQHWWEPPKKQQIYSSPAMLSYQSLGN